MKGTNGQRWPDVKAKGVNDVDTIVMGDGGYCAMDGGTASMGNCGGIEG
jgi:hypothetical protein